MRATKTGSDVGGMAAKEVRILGLEYYVHESSYIDEGVMVGANTHVERFTHIMKGTRIGKNCQIGHNVVIYQDCWIGDNCLIGDGAILRPGTKIGNNSVFGTLSQSEGNNQIGNGVTIHSQCHIAQTAVIEDDVFIAPFFCGANTKRISHGRSYPLIMEGYRIKRGSRIAIGVLVLPDVTIGEECLIGVGTVVTKDIPDYSIAYGVPARIVGSVPDEERLRSQHTSL
jgi:acetyltransferase-like isoleucine patch superfamily enzyme